MALRTAAARIARPLSRGVRAYGSGAGGPKAVESMGAARPPMGGPKIMAPGGSVPTNTYVEEWTAHRENVYKHFKIRDRVGQLFGAVVVFPLVCWAILRNECVEKDNLDGKEPRRYL